VQAPERKDYIGKKERKDKYQKEKEKLILSLSSPQSSRRPFSSLCSPLCL
jgi:hypothetical protein